MAELTQDERSFIRALVEKELKLIEKHEHDFQQLLNNSPVLSQLLMRNKNIPFLATQEKYHEFLKALLEKL